MNGDPRALAAPRSSKPSGATVTTTTAFAIDPQSAPASRISAPAWSRRNASPNRQTDLTKQAMNLGSGRERRVWSPPGHRPRQRPALGTWPPSPPHPHRPPESRVIRTQRSTSRQRRVLGIEEQWFQVAGDGGGSPYSRSERSVDENCCTRSRRTHHQINRTIARGAG